MVYKRKSAKRKSYRKKPVFKRTTTRPARKVEVKRSMRAVDTDLVSNPLTAANQVPFTNIGGGSDADERIGNAIQARGHLTSGILRNNTDKAMIVRCLKLYNRRNANSAVSESTDLFLSLGQPENATNLGFKTLFSVLNKQQFKFISDKRYKLGSSANNADNLRIIKDYTKLSHQVRYTNNNGSNIDWGNLQVVWFAYPADGSAGVNDTVSLDVESSVYYTE